MTEDTLWMQLYDRFKEEYVKQPDNKERRHKTNKQVQRFRSQLPEELIEPFDHLINNIDNEHIEEEREVFRGAMIIPEKLNEEKKDL